MGDVVPFRKPQERHLSLTEALKTGRPIVFVDDSLDQFYFVDDTSGTCDIQVMREWLKTRRPHLAADDSPLIESD